MEATLRWYSGNAGLADQLAERGDEIRDVIGGIDGVRAYYLVRTGDGTVSITVGDSTEAIEESNRAAASWLRENMPDVAASPPSTSMGEVVISF